MSIPQKTRICLNSMVGNEEKTILRMLESCEPYVDYWVIQCNGNDKTREIIEDFFKSKNKPGFCYNIEWNFPGWNRNHTLQTCLKAEHNCDWILRMDADERLHVDENFDWSILQNTSIESYNILATNGGLKYYRTWFWNAKLPWFFADDKRHETIHLPEVGEGFQRINMPNGFRHLVSQDGETWTVPRKFLRDALELEIDKVVSMKVLEDNYHLWYLAKSYADCYGNPDELPFGRIHSEEYARRAIWYFERYLEKNHPSIYLTSSSTNYVRTDNLDDFNEMSYFAMILIGDAYYFLKQNDKADQYYEKAPLFCSGRNEHLLQKCFMLEQLGKTEELKETLLRMLDRTRTNPFPDNVFLIDDRAYYDSSSFLQDWLERIDSVAGLPVVSDESFDFFS